jgi:hypothetical protein
MTWVTVDSTIDDQTSHTGILVNLSHVIVKTTPNPGFCEGMVRWKGFDLVLTDRTGTTAGAKNGIQKCLHDISPVLQADDCAFALPHDPLGHEPWLRAPARQNQKF